MQIRILRGKPLIIIAWTRTRMKGTNMAFIGHIMQHLKLNNSLQDRVVGVSEAKGDEFGHKGEVEA